MTKSERNIVLVTGVPRSGASMLIRMLQAGGVSVFRAKVGQPSDGADCDNAGIRFLRVSAEGLAPAIGGAVRIDHDLLYALPGCYQYHMILMRRELNEIAALQEAEKHAPSTASPSSSKRLIARVRRQQKLISAWLEHRPQVKVLQISHSEIRMHSSATVATIDQFLGGGLDTDGMQVEAKRTESRRLQDS